jgi:hypothetical protein
VTRFHFQSANQIAKKGQNFQIFQNFKILQNLLKIHIQFQKFHIKFQNFWRIIVTHMGTKGEFVSPIINTNFFSKSFKITDLITCVERHETF